MKLRSFSAVLILLAAAITALITYFRDGGLKTMVIALLAVIVIFYFIGSVIELVFKKFEAQNNSKVADEGEVIEKDAAAETGEAEGLIK